MRPIENDEVIFKKYYKSLCHFAWQMLHDTQAAEDVVQDAFMTYFDKKDMISPDEPAIRSFLYTSVKFACYKNSRREKVNDKYRLSITEDDLYDDHDVEFKIIKSEVMAEIHRIVETMPEACQKICRMGYLEGLSTKEIAEELQLSVSTVKTQKQRGMKIIIGNLSPEYLALVLPFFHNF